MTLGDNLRDLVNRLRQADDALIPRTLVDAKGDLIVGTAADVVGRLPVGADGTVATADSSAPEGIAWAAPEAGLKSYSTTAEIDAVEVPEQGIYRFATSAEAVAYFGAAGGAIFFAGEALVTSLLSDNYGSGYAPGASGRMQQTVLLTDGYGTNMILNRARGYVVGVGWQSWDPWTVVPLPNVRPSSFNGPGLWRGDPDVGGDGDGWAYTLEPTQPTGAGANEPAMWDRIAQVWATWFNDASRQTIEGGELRMRSAGFDFQGILDAARTDVGTVAFAARGSSLPTQTNRVEATAAAAGTAAVAGFSIPLGIMTRFGTIFHATFSMQSGMSSNTRLLCGLVATADLAAAMADNDPSAVSNYFAAGYGSAGNVGAFQRATSTLSSSDSGQAPSTSANQLIDFRAFASPNGGTLRYLLHIRTGSTVIRTAGTLSNNPSINAPLSFFIRASAGGTSATPKVALHRLRVGNGFGTLGGS